MQLYILKKGVEFVIYKVQEEDVLFFERKYKEQILLQADDLMQLLLLFEKEWMFGLSYKTNGTRNSAV